MVNLAPRITLNDGHTIPQLGLGTWPLNDAEAADVVEKAIGLGYRHIDTAVKYGNEEGVGEGIRRSGIDRAELFVTTKLDGAFQGDDKALVGISESLGRLGLDYVDLLLIHWPLPARDLYVSTWKTFEHIAARGQSRSIGVSNFMPAHLDRLIAETSTVPAVNQIQVNPEIPRLAQRAYGEEHDIITESWSPLGGDGAALLDSTTLVEIGAQYGKSAGQVVLRWHVQSGLVAIPKTTSAHRLTENLDVFDFELSDADFEAIARLSKGPDAGVDSDATGH